MTIALSLWVTPDLRLLADSHPFSAVTLLPGFLLFWLLRPAFLWVRSHGLGMGPLLVLTEQGEHVGLVSPGAGRGALVGRGGPYPRAAETWSLLSSSLCGLIGKVRCPPSTRALVGRGWCLGAEAWIARQECLASCCYILERERQLSVGSVSVLPALGLLSACPLPDWAGVILSVCTWPGSRLGGSLLAVGGVVNVAPVMRGAGVEQTSDGNLPTFC